MILFVVLSFVMVFILIWQQIQHKKLVREIDYITSREYPKVCVNLQTDVR